MPTSFIHYKKNGFWIKDGIIVLLISYLTREIDKYDNKPDWLKEFNSKLKIQEKGFFHGFQSLDLDTYLINKELIELFTKILNKVAGTVRSKGKEISVDELNSYVIDEKYGGKWIRPFEVKRLIKVIYYLLNLVKGKLSLKASDKIDYYF